jgi:hypothetical protein
VCFGESRGLSWYSVADKNSEKGDIVNIDVAVIKDGWFGDTSRMYFAGEPSPQARRLVNTTYEAMRAGIMQVRPGRHWAMSAMRYRPSRIAMVSAWCVNTAATVSVKFIMMNRRYCITANVVKVCASKKA